MEAANRGAHDAGAPSIGFNITLPTEQQPNAYTTPELTFRFHYFAMRKMHLAMRANALVVFPGGFGTMDELFEILTLVQTRKAPPLPIVLFDEALLAARSSISTRWSEEEMIGAEDLRAVRLRRHRRGGVGGPHRPRIDGPQPRMRGWRGVALRSLTQVKAPSSGPRHASRCCFEEEP